MKISIRDVQFGRFFVNSNRVREITAEFGDSVIYRSYNFDTGDLYHEIPSRCSKKLITRWAEREATPEEVARMKRDEADFVEEQVSLRYIQRFLNSIPGKTMIAELLRRGLLHIEGW